MQLAFVSVMSNYGTVVEVLRSYKLFMFRFCFCFLKYIYNVPSNNQCFHYDIPSFLELWFHISEASMVCCIFLYPVTFNHLFSRTNYIEKD